MNRVQFEEYINNPTLLSEASIPELKSVTESFPWFQSAYLLYVKALSNSGHTDYFDYLKKTSILVSDRKALYQLINKKAGSTTEILPATKTEEVISPENQSSRNNSIEPENTDQQETPEIVLTSNQAGTHTPTDIIIEKVDQAVEPEEKISTSKKVELIVTPRENISVKTADSSAKITEPSLETNKPIESSPVFSDLNDVIVNPVVNAYIEKEILHVTDIHKPVSEHKSSSENQSPEKEKQILKETLNEPHSFSEWLKLMAQKQAQPIVAKAEAPRQDNPDDVPTVNNENRSKKQAIIDHLIQHEPGHIRIKESTEFFTPARHARESNREDETLVTETLAWIYEQQGNYAKAIRAYQILSLKFPEKSVYFAGLIQKIKIKQKEK